MYKHSKEELQEATRAITSTLEKSEKAQLKLKVGTIQHTMTVQGIKAYKIAIKLLNNELISINSENSIEARYMKEELVEAYKVLTSTISRVEKVLPKFNPGTSQHTLAIRRIKAFQIASKLIKREFSS